jgi:hypothetical protein
MAIAQEALRWMADLDALIDDKTRDVLPEDAKARNVLRIMLHRRCGWVCPAMPWLPPACHC